MGRALTPDRGRPLERRALDVLGLLCLIATLLLLSSGVRIARAGDADPARMSIDPELVERYGERAAGQDEAEHATDPVAALEAEHATDPVAALEAEHAAIAAERAAPGLAPGAAGIEMRPGVAGVEVAPGVIVLNTTGYNVRPVGGPAPSR